MPGFPRNASRAEREDVEAQPEKLNLWLGSVSHEPVQIATETADLSLSHDAALLMLRTQKRPKTK